MLKVFEHRGIVNTLLFIGIYRKEVLALSIVLAVVLHVSIEKLRKLYGRNKPQPNPTETVVQVR